jgi:hypothetical protein
MRDIGLVVNRATESFNAVGQWIAQLQQMLKKSDSHVTDYHADRRRIEKYTGPNRHHRPSCDSSAQIDQ